MTHHEKAMDSLDACIFSGDLLWIDEERKQLKQMLVRWTKAVEEHEREQEEQK